MLNFSEACERNKDPILKVLRNLFRAPISVLEIGSGSGQHAIYFSRQLPHLHWQPSEVPALVDELAQNLYDLNLDNLAPPLALDVNHPAWPLQAVDAVFTANTLHIMGWEEVEQCFLRIGEVLAPKGRVCVYGPFRYRGRYTSESNAHFDVWLKNRDMKSGIRDFEAVDRLAEAQGLTLENDFSMPANNQLLVWRR